MPVSRHFFLLLLNITDIVSHRRIGQAQPDDIIARDVEIAGDADQRLVALAVVLLLVDGLSRRPEGGVGTDAIVKLGGAAVVTMVRDLDDVALQIRTVHFADHRRDVLRRIAQHHGRLPAQADAEDQRGGVDVGQRLGAIVVEGEKHLHRRAGVVEDLSGVRLDNLRVVEDGQNVTHLGLGGAGFLQIILILGREVEDHLLDGNVIMVAGHKIVEGGRVVAVGVGQEPAGDDDVARVGGQRFEAIVEIVGLADGEAAVDQDELAVRQDEGHAEAVRRLISAGVIEADHDHLLGGNLLELADRIGAGGQRGVGGIDDDAHFLGIFGVVDVQCMVAAEGGEAVVGCLMLGVQGVAGRRQLRAVGLKLLGRGILNVEHVRLVAEVDQLADQAVKGGDAVERLAQRLGLAVVGGNGADAVSAGIVDEAVDEIAGL